MLDEHGGIFREAEVASDPVALAKCAQDQPARSPRSVLRPGPLSQWLHRGLTDAGLDAVLVETRQVKGVLKLELAEGSTMLELAIGPMLHARASLRPANSPGSRGRCGNSRKRTRSTVR